VQRILVVDDQLEAAQLLSTLLELDGYQVEVLEDSWSDLTKQMEVRRPDMLILDVRLPGVSGLELLEQIRRHPNPDVSKVAVILASALDHRYEGEKAGMDGYLLKPYTRQEVLDAIKGIEANRVSA
jgi:CheY-like chemotaxis protein